jgi:hypothetical protein
LSFKDSSIGEREQAVEYVTEGPYKMLFQSVNTGLTDFFRSSGLEFYLLIDEWSSLPQDIQPIVAEYIKRSFLPNPKLTTKIAALEYRSRFNARLSSGYLLGFEVGADIDASIEIDDYYLYDRDPSAMSTVFSQILFKHLTSELPLEYLLKAHSIDSPDKFIEATFKDRSIFDELVRASEGVVRDSIHIFLDCFLAGASQEGGAIERLDVLESARTWFQRDKSANLGALRVLFDMLANGAFRVRTKAVLVPQSVASSEPLQSLVDARVLHVLDRNYNASAPWNTETCVVFSIDYGAYAELLLRHSGDERTKPGPKVPGNNRASALRAPMVSADKLAEFSAGRA